MTERRIFPRAPIKSSVRIDRDLLGQITDLSETGLSFITDRSLLYSKIYAEIQLLQEQPINAKCKVIWKNYLFGEGKFKFGVRFADLEPEDIGLIRKVVCSNREINKNYIQTAESFASFMESVKNEFDEYDIRHSLKAQRIQFLESRKIEIFMRIQSYLKDLWGILRPLEKSNLNLYTHYLRAIANDLFIHFSEINDHIFKKPLGYPGDFMVMNYIFKYHRDSYLGESSYKMLINHYACNVPIAVSNIRRKEFFKNKILEVVNSKENVKILSIGSGPSRELLELLSEGRLKKNFTFHCLDFEKKALDYVKIEIRKISPEKKLCCTVGYINKNLLDLIKKRSFEGLLNDYDFVYCSGVFDYLKDRLAVRLIDILYSLLSRNGTLILCNANHKDSFYRVAYEVMGDWVFYHREKEQLLQWLKNIKDAEEIKFEELSNTSNYLFLTIKTQS